MRLRLCTECRLVLLQGGAKIIGTLFLISGVGLGSLLAIYLYFYFQLIFFLSELRLYRLVIMLVALITVETARRIGDHLLFDFNAENRAD
jgi:hypothetical protein